MRSVSDEWSEPTTTTSPMPCATSSTRRRMKARMRISPSSASVCTSACTLSRFISITSAGSPARIRNSERRPDSMLTSPLNWPGPCTATRDSPASVRRTISRYPFVTTKKGTTLAPSSTRISPA
jgi:hypothetical protein